MQSKIAQFANTILLSCATVLLFCTITNAAEPPFQLPQATELAKIRSAVMATSKGNVYLELFPDDAPWHVANFKFLADRGFFNGAKISQYLPDYIVQAGSTKKLEGIAPYTLPAEFSERRHEKGILGMARQSNDINPERRSSFGQFHILLNPAPHMNGHYTIFGKVVSGFNAVSNLRKGDTIYSVKVFIRPSGLPLVENE